MTVPKIKFLIIFINNNNLSIYDSENPGEEKFILSIYDPENPGEEKFIDIGIGEVKDKVKEILMGEK